MNTTRKQRDIKKHSVKTARRRRREKTIQKRKTRKDTKLQKRRERHNILNNIQQTFRNVRNTIKMSDRSVESKRDRTLESLLSLTPDRGVYNPRDNPILRYVRKFHNTLLNKGPTTSLRFDKSKLTEEYLDINKFTPVFLKTHGRYPLFSEINNIPGQHTYQNLLFNPEQAFIVVPRDVVFVEYSPFGSSLLVKDKITEELLPEFIVYIFNDIINGNIVNTSKGRKFLIKKIYDFLLQTIIQRKVVIIKLNYHIEEKLEKIVNTVKETIFNFILKIMLPSLRIYTEGSLYYNLVLSLHPKKEIREPSNMSKEFVCSEQLDDIKDKVYSWNTYGNENFSIQYKSKTDELFVNHPDINKYFTYNSKLYYEFENKYDNDSIFCQRNNGMFLSELLHYGFLSEKIKSRRDFNPKHGFKYIFFVHSCRLTPKFDKWPESDREKYKSLFRNTYNMGKYQKQFLHSPYMLRNRRNDIERKTNKVEFITMEKPSEITRDWE